MASKQILDRINRKVSVETNANQWKSTAAVINWFTKITNKDQHIFIVFDVVDFYPSISPELLNKALNFASTYETITPKEREIILHTKKSILCKSDEYWGKKSAANLFDVTMGCYDGAECCEMVGLYLLHLITTRHGNKFGLYRDDGLGVINASPRRVEITKKALCATFKEVGLKITVEANRKVINYLDISLNLTNGSFAPYNKPGNTPAYVHSKSNHPPTYHQMQEHSAKPLPYTNRH